jgi:hypothetical protein
MTTLVTPANAPLTVADLLERLGGISPARVLLRPAPGQATEQDVLEMERRENRLCELEEGTLVEKAMGFRESLLAMAMVRFLLSPGTWAW